MSSDTVHPRPQLTRPGWHELCGVWRFAFDDEDVGLLQGWPERDDRFTREITVPFPPESDASGIGDHGVHPVLWYRREVTLPPIRPDQRVLLHVNAVDYRAHVWVNGRLVARHEGGQTPFSADIKPELRSGGDQVIVVRAEDQPHDLTQPRGKQDWQAEPHAIWYHRTSGIWQPVWFEIVPAIHFAAVRWLPDLDRGLLGVALTLSRAPERPLHCRLRLTLNGEVLADDRYGVTGPTISRAVALDLAKLTMNRDQLLWAPGHPNLIDADLTLLAGDEVVDTVGSYVGMRSAGVGDGRFFLNGRAYYPRLVLEQGYWPESHLAAPSPAALQREVELVKELGFNGVRIHQKVEDPRFLYWCDRLGVMVWGEMANAYVFSEEAIERLTREWIDVIRRDRNHPSVVTWMPVNESWGVPHLEHSDRQQAAVRGLYHLTRALDPTRPVIGNDGWEHVADDILGIHDYTPSGAILRERYGSRDAIERTLHEHRVSGNHAMLLPGYERWGQPVMITEFGGISYAPQAGEAWFGYGTVRSEEEYLAKYEELVGSLLDSTALAGFCYTQLTDTEQETNGLLTADRTPKLDPAVIREITSRPARAVKGS